MTERRLTRSTTDRQVAGVAGGVAAYFDLDPNLVRIAWVVAALAGGAGVFLYVILWIVLPEGAARRPAVAIAEERYARGEITADELREIRRTLEDGA